METIPENHSQELRKKRESLGLSLEDLFNKTRVRVVYLQAIENEEFHLLPVPVYARNFIKIYARALGIDSGPIVKKYEDYLNSGKAIHTEEPKEEPDKKNLLGKINGHKIYWSVAFVLIAVIIVSWMISKQNESSPDIVNPSNSVSGNMQENKEQNVKSPSEAVVTAPGQAQSNLSSEQNRKNQQLRMEMQKSLVSAAGANIEVKPLKEKVLLPVEKAQVVSDVGERSLLVIRATEETWMRVKADQNPSFHVLLKPGEKFEQRAASFNVDIGNAGGVKVQFKGKNIENLGNAGEVIHLRLP